MTKVRKRVSRKGYQLGLNVIYKPCIFIPKNLRYMNSKLFRGSLETIVLKLLSENKEMYGYEITQKVKEMTVGEVKITEGALYPTLHKLEGKGLLDTTTKNIGNRYRKYYSLTKKGEKEKVALLEDMAVYMQSMQLILNPIKS